MNQHEVVKPRRRSTNCTHSPEKDRAVLLAIAMMFGAFGCGNTAESRSAPSSTTDVSSASSAPIPAPSASATPTPVKPKRNVLLITIDSLRYDMPWHGYPKAIAPNLTKLASKSAVYNNAYAISSFTSKSVGALLSGQYPSTLYRGPTFFTKYSNANTFFPELLQKGGVRTLAGHAHGYFDRGKNLRQGFDVWRMVPDLKWDAEKDVSVTSQDMTPMAIDMLKDKKTTAGQFFMWLHYMDPHDKYIPHDECPKFGRNARALYDNEVCYTDLWIQKLLTYCETQPWWKDTVVILTADHGEAFGEHGHWRHAFALWEVLNHVPMFVMGPGIKAQQITERRSHIDLAPTILDLLGVKPNPNLAGRSLVPELLGDEPPGNRDPILLDLPADSYNPRTKATIVGDFKLIEDPNDKFHLYDLKGDPSEKRNLIGSSKHKAKLAELKTAHEKAWAKHPYVAPWGGKKLAGGLKANGPFGPKGIKDADTEPGVP